MPTMWCVCGHVLATQTDYLPFQGQFFIGGDESEVERIVDALAYCISDESDDDSAEPAESAYPEAPRPAPHASLDAGMLACERCGRVWMRTAPQSGGKYLF